MNYLLYLSSFLSVGSFVMIDLIAATTNAFNGALLVQRQDYYKGRRWTIIGIILFAIFGGIGGGVSRDVILAKIPGAFTNPWYLILCIAAGVAAMLTSYYAGQKFREGTYQFMTAFSLPWYAVIGVQAGLNAHLPYIACIALGVVGPTAGRYLIDITAGNSAKQFVQGEWFVGTAALSALAFLILTEVFLLTIWPATLLAVLIGFTFRVVAMWKGWEEPMPRSAVILGEVVPQRETLKKKLKTK